MKKFLIFDGKAKYYFKFPWAMSTVWKAGSEIRYQLSWQDDKGMNYTGFEKIIKHIVG
jgi:hypothetical protein